jgi:superfamily II RNA helicase
MSIEKTTEFINNLSFEVSEFQKKAFENIEQGNHVLVTAHTGSGKTLPAEFAINYFTHEDLRKKVIYTSPIKALSNQKFEEFSRKFPEIEVGIMTGDIKHNPGADLLIMTTEILQNYLFKKKNNVQKLDFDIDIDTQLGCVIFDEVHYIDDPDRGTVWEQTMIMLPNHVQFVMLSATIGQKEQFAQWISGIKNKHVEICSTDKRVVPLYFYNFFTVPDKYIEKIKDKKRKYEYENKKSKLELIKSPETYNQSTLAQSTKFINEISRDSFRVTRKFVIDDVLKVMKEQDMFPSLFFVFSRKQVERIAKEITTNLFDEGEKDYKVEPIMRQILVSKVTNWKEYTELPEYKVYLDLLEKGIAIHHAGMLPIFREVIEMLYDKKYIKCLIATETFAIGLNMPTRSVVFTSLFKHDGVQLRQLRSHEFIQMAGRAGRRNIDTKGNVIILSNTFEPLDTSSYYQMFHSTPKVIQSKYKINFSLILNYMNHFTEEEFKNFIEKSMMNLDIIKETKHAETLIDKLENETETMKNNFSVKMSLLQEYDTLKQKFEYSNNKTKKKIRSDITKMEFNNRNIKNCYETEYQKYKEKMDELSSNEKYKYYAETYIQSQISSIYSILNENKFINDENKLNEKGKNACLLHEINGLVFCDAYDNYDKFTEWSETDILMFLSIFYDIKINDELKTIIPTQLKNEIKFVNERLEYYQDQEAKYQLSGSNNYSIQYDMMTYLKEWYENVENETDTRIFFQKVISEKDIFIGDFIKCCLKIVNIIKEISLMCEENNDYDLLEKLKNIENNIQKSIVSNSSLYV